MGKVFGVGVNDSPTPLSRHEKVGGKYIVVWECPYYRRWRDLLKRCYSKPYKDKHPTYTECTVCDKWLVFSNFKQWMEQQQWEGMVLDKDLLVYKNKHYSPENCCFIPPDLNQFIVMSDSTRGDYPIGCRSRPDTVKYQSEIKLGGKSKYLGLFTTIAQAHRAWQKAKLDYAIYLLDKYKDEPLRTREGLQRVISKLNYDIQHNLETQDL